MKIKSAHFVKGITGDDAILHDKTPQIAFVGRSNVGKSSLINSLLNKRELAKTGKKQGKTTEINIYDVNEKYYFVDLPGYGFAQGGFDQREKIREMILGYLTNASAMPHTVAIVIDSKVGLTDFDRDMLEILRDNNHHGVIVFNKTDKLSQREVAAGLKDIAEECPGVTVLPYSSTLSKGAGLVLQKLTE